MDREQDSGRRLADLRRVAAHEYDLTVSCRLGDGELGARGGEHPGEHWDADDLLDDAPRSIDLFRAGPNAVGE
jgi:hypothetical protein